MPNLLLKVIDRTPSLFQEGDSETMAEVMEAEASEGTPLLLGFSLGGALGLKEAVRNLPIGVAVAAQKAPIPTDCGARAAKQRAGVQKINDL